MGLLRKARLMMAGANRKQAISDFMLHRIVTMHKCNLPVAGGSAGRTKEPPQAGS